MFHTQPPPLWFVVSHRVVRSVCWWVGPQHSSTVLDACTAGRMHSISTHAGPLLPLLRPPLLLLPYCPALLPCCCCCAAVDASQPVCACRALPQGGGSRPAAGGLQRQLGECVCCWLRVGGWQQQQQQWTVAVCLPFALPYLSRCSCLGVLAVTSCAQHGVAGWGRWSTACTAAAAAAAGHRVCECSAQEADAAARGCGV